MKKQINTLLFLGLSTVGIGLMTLPVLALETVNLGSGGSDHSTIQAAINAASTGESIDVYEHPSTVDYFESVTINKVLGTITAKDSFVWEPTSSSSLIVDIGTSGDVTMDGFFFTGADHVNWGGAINNKGKLVLDYVVIYDCTSNLGGAIYNAGTGTLRLTGSLIQSCDASASGGGIFNAGELTLDGDSSIYDCTAVNSGGGIHNFSASSELTMDYSEIVACVAGSAGGVGVISGVATIENSLFQFNEATGTDGGGLYTSNSNNIYLDNTIFRDNDANGLGGAIFDNVDSNYTNSSYDDGDIFDNSTPEVYPSDALDL
ncbi:MAG: hypothetical protein KDN22_00260 [Verrucomicrobiae bacterium]|nr:hypothetical protein [Verrucomicrobiae bacterium]